MPPLFWCRLLACVALAVGCGGKGEREEQPFTCAFGELSGTWVMRHTEIDGDCGAVADRRVNFGSAGELRPEGCSTDGAVISIDKCGLHQDFDCPLEGTDGRADWVVVLSHEAAARIGGVGSVAVSPAVCVSSYDIVLTPL